MTLATRVLILITFIIWTLISRAVSLCIYCNTFECSLAFSYTIHKKGWPLGVVAFWKCGRQGERESRPIELSF